MHMDHISVTVQSQISCNRACTGSSTQLRLYLSIASVPDQTEKLDSVKGGIDHCIHSRQSWDSLEIHNKWHLCITLG